MRNQALYKKAKSLELLGRKQEAITTFYEVLEKSASGGREYFWTYKAGIDAGEIFEKDKQWTSAIGVYEKLALLGGPRTDEVRERIQRLELKHFIMDSFGPAQPWEEPLAPSRLHRLALPRIVAG